MQVNIFGCSRQCTCCLVDANDVAGEAGVVAAMVVTVTQGSGVLADKTTDKGGT